MSNEYMVTVDPGKCIACYGCAVACKATRGLPVGEDWVRVQNKWHGKGLDVRSTYYAVICQHCVDAPCLASCPEKAISKSDSGAVVVDAAKCNGCESCLPACPYGVPQFSQGDKKIMHKCDLCQGLVDTAKGEQPPCAINCPTAALKLEDAGAEGKKKSMAALKAFCNAPRVEM